MRKTIYTGKLPTSKKRTRNLFGFSFNTTTNNLEGKAITNFFRFSLNTQEESEKRNKLPWIIQRKSMNTDN